MVDISVTSQECKQAADQLAAKHMLVKSLTQKSKIYAVLG